MTNPKCFICHDVCLGLHGQDAHCDTVFAVDSAEDRLMVEEFAFGECHLRCLTGSKWGSYWSSRILDNLISVRNYPIIGQIGGLKALRNERIKTTFLVRDDGWMTEIHDQRIKQSGPVDSGFHVPVEQELYVDLSDRGTIADELRRIAGKNGELPLQKLIDYLSIQDHLLYPAAVELGLLHLRTIKNLPSTVIAADATYNEFLPHEVVQIILTHIYSE